jgi:hypothetical protein
VQELQDIPRKADRIAERRFPNSARDRSTKNAFRHALGTGMVTHHLGGGILGAVGAKLAGYAWEVPNLLTKQDNPEVQEDVRHDLNANAIGAAVATKVGSQEELIQQLDWLARRAKVGKPPSIFELSDGQLTRSVQ